MSRNLAVFSDGTGQEGGVGHSTNVYKLFNMVLNRAPDQITFYDPGLGTGWRKITGNVAGMGVSRNIRDCYEFLFQKYRADDRIYLFGFSRGAATVRSLSGFLHQFGILPESREKLIRKAYRIYRIRDRKEREAKAAEFRGKHHNMWCKIRFLGVWDTVTALGLPFKPLDDVLDRIPPFQHHFHNLTLSPSVENAFQALAIDDERLLFHPAIWDSAIDPGYQTMKQVWFCGSHTDVGGGYPETGLSDLALEWMVQSAVDHGLRLYPRHEVRTNPDPDGVLHDSRGRWNRIYRRQVRAWNPKTHGKPTVHGSVLERTRGRNQKKDPPYHPWILDQEFEVEPWRKGLPEGGSS